MLNTCIMKNNITIASLLGISQKNMALLLRVSTSQWSMYELGQRNIPLTAKRMVAEMLGFLKFEGVGSKVLPHIELQEQSKKQRLEKMVKENEHQLYSIAKKIAAAEKKYNDNLKTIQLMEYLATVPAAKELLDGELMQIIAKRAARALEKTGLADLTALQVKEEVLQLEKSVLVLALGKWIVLQINEG